MKKILGLLALLISFASTAHAQVIRTTDDVDEGLTALARANDKTPLFATTGTPEMTEIMRRLVGKFTFSYIQDPWTKRVIFECHSISIPTEGLIGPDGNGAYITCADPQGNSYKKFSPYPVTVSLVPLKEIDDKLIPEK